MAKTCHTESNHRIRAGIVMQVSVLNAKAWITRMFSRLLDYEERLRTGGRRSGSRYTSLNWSDLMVGAPSIGESI
jgi:hypothetical protein